LCERVTGMKMVSLDKDDPQPMPETFFNIDIRDGKPIMCQTFPPRGNENDQLCPTYPKKFGAHQKTTAPAVVPPVEPRGGFEAHIVISDDENKDADKKNH
jgi:hypothetical protein